MTGSTIIPDSERFTLSTSATWCSIERFRCTIPIPPARASAIASRASVTVSIAAETTGIWSEIDGVSRVTVETSFGSTSDSAGSRSTSSNVSPSFPNFRSKRDEPLDLILAELGLHARTLPAPRDGDQPTRAAIVEMRASARGARDVAFRVEESASAAAREGARLGGATGRA